MLLCVGALTQLEDPLKEMKIQRTLKLAYGSAHHHFICPFHTAELTNSALFALLTVARQLPGFDFPMMLPLICTAALDSLLQLVLWHADLCQVHNGVDNCISCMPSREGQYLVKNMSESHCT